MPFGFVVASVGRRHVQESWVGVDDVAEFRFLARQNEVEKIAVKR